METIEKDCTALGSLFNAIINDMRGSTVIWEDFSTKATKLHSSLKTTVLSISSFLESFQKVADMATGTKGATKEIGSALTRLCIRHKSIENKLKSLTSCIFDTMVNPLQDKMEEWKKTVAQLDKDHAKECKKARADIKKAASDTIRLQKKAKKGNKDMQNRLDTALHEVNDKFMLLEDAEKMAIRTALIEERARFCMFVNCFKPFVDLEIGLLTEVTHLQEIMDHLTQQTKDPATLPASSEQVILDLKGIDPNTWNVHQLADRPTPPSSPSSLGSRKSSMCSSINSINSSSSGSNNQPLSPGHRYKCTHASSQMSQPVPIELAPRLTSVSSQDSGFTSQDTLFHRSTTPSHTLEFALPQTSDNVSISGESTPGTDSSNSTPSEQASTPSASSTWTNWPDPPKSGSSDVIRPHTISAVYEKSHSRPPLTTQMFEPLVVEVENRFKTPERPHRVVEEPVYARPATITKMKPVLPPLGPKPKSKAVAPPTIPADFILPAELPAYVNMNELVNMAAEKQQREQEARDGQITPVNTAPSLDSDASSKDDLYENDDLDIREAIRDLDSCTAALHCDYEIESLSGDTRPQAIQTSLELAEAIRELEASTAALQCGAEVIDTNASHGSLQSSSGYDTMSSTPSSSETTIAPTDSDSRIAEQYFHDRNKYYTLPRNYQAARIYRPSSATQRPASTAGMPLSSNRQAGKPPPPPVRRSSSISTGPISDAIDKGKLSPRRASATTAYHAPPEPLTKPKHHQLKQPSHVVHRRSRSIDGTSEPTADTADGQTTGGLGDEQRQKDDKCAANPQQHVGDQRKSSQSSINQTEQRSRQSDSAAKHQHKHAAQQQEQQRNIAKGHVDRDGVEHRPHGKDLRTMKDRSSCPVKSPTKGFGTKQHQHAARCSENLEGHQSGHYATPSVNRQSAFPSPGIYGVPDLAQSHANVVQSLSSKFASINRHDDAATTILKPAPARSHYVRSRGDHPLAVTPEESHYAQPVFLGAASIDEEFPAPPSAEELAAMHKDEYNV